MRWFDCDRGLFSTTDEHLDAAEYFYDSVTETPVKLFLMMLWAEANDIPYNITTIKKLSLVVDNTK